MSLLIGAPVVLEGTQCLLGEANVPSVKTLGYFWKAPRAKHKSEETALGEILQTEPLPGTRLVATFRQTTPADRLNRRP